MAIEVATLAALTAQLIGVGLSTLKASETAGWAREESDAFKGALGTIPALKALLPEKPAAMPFAALYRAGNGGLWGGLTTPRGRPVVEWLQGRSEERGYLIRELLAAKLSSFR